MERLIVEAERRDMRVLLDLVPNHTSDAHPWFHDETKRDWYVWRDPKPDGSPPNNWKSVFGGAAWTLDPASGQYYLHNFLPEQPDLDWWNEDVRAAFDDISRFWFERGISGFRSMSRTRSSRTASCGTTRRRNPATRLGGCGSVSARSTTSGALRPSTYTGAGGALRGSSTPSACCWARRMSCRSRTS